MTKGIKVGVILATGVFVGAFSKGLQDSKIVEEGQEFVGKVADKGVEKLKGIINKTKGNKRVDTEEALVRFQTFYARTAQFGAYENISLKSRVPEGYNFNSYSEAKVNMIEETIPKDLTEKQKDDMKELYSLIMDYGLYVGEVLAGKENNEETINEQEVEVTK